MTLRIPHRGLRIADCGYALARVVASLGHQVRMPRTFPVLAAATILLVTAIVASLLPAARAARVIVMQALRSE